jgi:glutamate synthase domain-containing protein 1
VLSSTRGAVGAEPARATGASILMQTPHRFSRGNDIADEDDFERHLDILRKVISNIVYNKRERRLSGYYIVSLSCRTIVYKGMFLADQLGKYYPDLHEEDFESALALVHQRFSTNTFPSWSLAHPYRMICHSGEINTLRGNLNWMARARPRSHGREDRGRYPGGIVARKIHHALSISALRALPTRLTPAAHAIDVA